MIVDQNEIETKKFQMYAEKAVTEARRIELCKKYLKSKGIDVDANLAQVEAARMIAPTAPERYYVGIRDLHVLLAESRIPEYIMSGPYPNNISDAKLYAYKHIGERLVHDLVDGRYIQFSEEDDLMSASRIIRGKIMVYKEKK